jgi:hypothetical protein
MKNPIFIRGSLWTLQRTRRGLGKSKAYPKGCWGHCSRENKTITIRPSKDFPTVEQEVDTIIHECLHGLWWDLDEEAVRTAATEIAAALRVSGLIPDKKDHQ